MVKDKIRILQDEVDMLYAEYGLTDEVLDKQLEVNRLKHKHDVADEEEIIYDGYVQ